MNIKTKYIAHIVIISMLLSSCQYFEKQYDIAAYVNDEEITVAGLDMFTLLAEYQIESLSSEEAFDMTRYGESDTLVYDDYKVYRDNQLNNLFIESYYTPDNGEYIDNYIKLVLKRQKVFDEFSESELEDMLAYFSTFAEEFVEHHNDNNDSHDSTEYNDDIYNIIITIANQNEITFKECANDIFVDVYLVNNKSLYFSDEYIINNLQLQPFQQTPIVENEIPTMDDWELIKNYYDYLEGLIFADIEFLGNLVLDADIDVVQ